MDSKPFQKSLIYALVMTDPFLQLMRAFRVGSSPCSAHMLSGFHKLLFKNLVAPDATTGCNNTKIYITCEKYSHNMKLTIPQNQCI